MFVKRVAAGLGTIAAVGLLSGFSASDASAEGPEFSANVALTTDYVFRGISQTAQGPAIQGGFDMTWDIFYAGVWGSNLDFGGGPTYCPGTGDCANIEIDVYMGITPKLGPVDFDFGVIYYAYPQASDAGGPEADFVELKAGASFSPVEALSLGATAYYGPDVLGAAVWTFEGSAEYSLPYDFALSGLIGYVDVDVAGADYTYWKVGLSKSFLEKFSAEIAYWDTDISGPGANCDGPVFQCDARVVGTLSASF